MIKTIFRTVIVAFSCVLAFAASGANYSWRGGSSGIWNDERNWQPSGTPKGGDVAKFSSTVTITDKVDVPSGTLEINKASPLTFNDEIRGSGAISFTGGGHLHLKAASSISGGITVKGGTSVGSTVSGSGSVHVYNSRALGVSLATIDGRTGPYLYVESGLSSIATPIYFYSSTMNNTGAVLVKNLGDFTFEETFDAAQQFSFGFVSPSGDYNVYFRKKFTVPHYLRSSPQTTSTRLGYWHFFEPMDSTTLWAVSPSEIHFYKAGNSALIFTPSSDVHYHAVNAIVSHPSSGTTRMKTWGFGANGKYHYLHGFNQRLGGKLPGDSKKITQPALPSNDFGFSSDEPAVLTMAFEGETFSDPVSVSWWGKFSGKVSFVWNAANPSSEFIFTNTPQPTTGEILVSNGVVRVTNGAGFSNVSRLGVALSGRLEIDSTAADISTSELLLGAGSCMSIGEGVEVAAQSATIGSVKLSDGVYDSSSGYFVGGGKLIVDSSIVNSWVGNVSGDWNTPSAWSLGHVPLSGETVRIGGGNAITLSASMNRVAVLELKAGAVLKTSGWNTEIRADKVKLGGTITQVANCGTVNPPQHRVHIVCGSLEIFSSGKIDTDGLGWVKGGGPGSKAPGYTSAAWGAAHGGYGSLPLLGVNSGDYPKFGFLYDDPYAPVLPGSGGGNENGLNGGGAVLIEAEGKVIVNGSINASGVDSPVITASSITSQVTCGSGGSIWIKCAAFEGDGGSIRADGGCGDVTCRFNWYAYYLWGLSSSNPFTNGGGGMIRIECGSGDNSVILRDMVISAKGGHGKGICAKNGVDRIDALTVATADKWRTEADLGTLTFTNEKIVNQMLGNGLSGRLIDYNTYTHTGNLNWNKGHVRFAKEGVDFRVTGSLVVDGEESRLEIGGIEVRTNVWCVADVYGGTKLNRLTVGGDLLVTGGAALDIRAAETNSTMRWGGEVIVGRDMIVGSGSYVYPWCDIKNLGASHFTVGRDFTLQSGGTVSADWRGAMGSWGTHGAAKPYFGKYGPDPYGYLPGNNGVGASYGGQGGQRAAMVDTEVVQVWGVKSPVKGDDNPYVPDMVGFGAATAGYVIGNPGAGLVYIEAGRSMVIDGRVSADACPSLDSSGGKANAIESYQCAGGGSGGGIYLACHSFSGSGEISARGGDATVNETKGSGTTYRNKSLYYSNAGGGGGRIGIEVGQQYKLKGGTVIYSRTYDEPEEPRLKINYSFTGVYDVSGGTNLWSVGNNYKNGGAPQILETYGDAGTVRFSGYSAKTGLGIIFSP